MEEKSGWNIHRMQREFNFNQMNNICYSGDVMWCDCDDESQNVDMNFINCGTHTFVSSDYEAGRLSVCGSASVGGDSLSHWVSAFVRIIIRVFHFSYEC